MVLLRHFSLNHSCASSVVILSKCIHYTQEYLCFQQDINEISHHIYEGKKKREGLSDKSEIPYCLTPSHPKTNKTISNSKISILINPLIMC